MECAARIILAPLLPGVLTLILAGCKSPATSSFASQPSLDGVWEGQIEMLVEWPVMRKRIIVRFVHEKGSLRATMDVPSSFAKGFPLRDLAVKDGTLHFSIPLGPGNMRESGEWSHLPLLIPGNANEGRKVEFEGKIEGDSIRGKTAAVPFPAAWHLRRSRADDQTPAAQPPSAGWERKERDYWPTREWKIATPAEEGIDPRGLTEAERVILENNPEARSLLVIRRGRLVYEKYFHGASGDQAFNVKSVTKSITSALTGIALREGLLRSLDEKVSDLLPEYFASQTDARKKQIALRHLLTMTAGFEWTENGPITADYFRSADPTKFIIDLPLVADPGKGHTYNTGVSHLLSAIITRQSKMSLLEFARQRLFGPIGINARRWDTDQQGIYEGGSELYLTPRDMARFGFLYLNAGRWERKEIVPADWVWESVRPHAAKGLLWADYGYQWWIGQVDDLPSFSARGYGGQLIHIVPKLDLVVVTTSTVSNPDNDLLLPILKHILPAVKESEGRNRSAK